jgi:hypothetical protein
MSSVFRWFDHKGGVIEATAPADGSRPTAWRWDDCRTHHMFGTPSSVPSFQALTSCGKRALEVPGRGPVDCPECLEVVNGLDAS